MCTNTHILYVNVCKIHVNICKWPLNTDLEYHLFIIAFLIQFYFLAIVSEDYV